MTARVGKVQIVTDKTGQTKIVRKRGYTTKQRHLKAAREEKAWRANKTP